MLSNSLLHTGIANGTLKLSISLPKMWSWSDKNWVVLDHRQYMKLSKLKWKLGLKKAHLWSCYWILKQWRNMTKRSSWDMNCKITSLCRFQRINGCNYAPVAAQALLPFPSEFRFQLFMSRLNMYVLKQERFHVWHTSQSGDSYSFLKIRMSQNAYCAKTEESTPVTANPKVVFCATSVYSAPSVIFPSPKILNTSFAGLF